MCEKILERINMVRKSNVFMKIESDKKILRFLILSDLNGLKEDREDYKELLELFYNNSLEKLLEELPQGFLYDMVLAYQTA